MPRLWALPHASAHETKGQADRLLLLVPRLVLPTKGLGMTSFARWLQKRGELPYVYARRQRLAKPAIYALAGIRAARTPEFFRTSTLERVSADTGIPATRLYAEAMDALKHEPRLPRRYTKRQQAAE
jgi:hypothetical protein